MSGAAVGGPAAGRPFTSEHDDEPQPGLPEPLPAGERLLWQGAPAARVLARRGFHLVGFGLYFGALIVWRVATLIAEGAEPARWVASLATMAALALLALGFIALFARLVERTALYTLTDRRVVLRIGVVLTVTFNLPLKHIEAAEVRRHPGGSGDIALRLLPGDRIGVMHLWPHCRPWRFARAEPMLRGLADVEPVARLLAEALRASLEADTRAEAQPAAERSDRPDRSDRSERPDRADAADGRQGLGHHLPHAA